MGSFLRYLIAFIVVSFGVVLILDNFGIETVTMKNILGFIFPMLCIVFGMKWTVDGIRRRSSLWAWGVLFLCVGTLLLLGKLDLITFTYGDLGKLWPVIIVYVGLLMFGFHSRYYKWDKKNKHIIINRRGNKDKHKRFGRFSIGDHEYSSPNWKVEPMELSSLAGDFYMDFTKAFIPEEEIPIGIHATAGDVRILIPEDLEFRVDANVSAGEITIAGQKVEGIGRTLQFESVGYPDAIRKIDFTLNLTAGDIRVDKI